MTSIPRHSIVIPAYNESERLGPTLDRVLAFVRQQMQKAGKYGDRRATSVPASQAAIEHG